MRLVFGLVLVLGLALSGFAVWKAREYFAVQQAQIDVERAARAQIVPTKQVYVLKKAVRYGVRLKPEDVHAVNWPVDAIPAGTFLVDEATLFPAGDPRPRTVLRAMEAGEAILAVKVTAPGEDAGVSSRLSKGMRAFAIQVDVQSGVSGFLRPGDRVDVYWTGQAVKAGPEGTARGGVTRLIETGVTLVAVDQSADGDRTGAAVARTVTVEVTAQQVAALAQAQASGRLTLSLVGAEDDTVARATEVDQRALLGVEDRTLVQADEPEKGCTVRTRKGGEVTGVTGCTN